MTTSRKVILSIAGSDPSGGAGIQADLKTFSSLGLYGCAVISAITVQNTRGVYRVAPVTPELIRAQIDLILEDMAVSHIKTGMVSSGEAAEAIGESLAAFRGVVVCDPVLKASSGPDLLPPAELDALLHHLISRATTLTPNLDELKTLTGLSSEEDRVIGQAAESLLEKFPRLEAVVVKGGHRMAEPGTVTDLLLHRRNGKVAMIKTERQRINTGNTHGTGCTFASALAAYHYRTGDWVKAFQLAGEYVGWLLTASAGIKTGQGTGPLHHHLFRNDR